MYLLINIVYTILDHITRLGMDDVGYWLALRPFDYAQENQALRQSSGEPQDRALHASSQPGYILSEPKGEPARSE